MKHMWKYDKKRDRVFCLRKKCDVSFKAGLKPDEKLKLPNCRNKRRD